MRQIARIKNTGKAQPASMPARILSAALCVITPITTGPTDAPRSPPMASSANSPVPPSGISPAAILMEPGHMMPTEKPHKMQPISPKTGAVDSAAKR